MKSVFFEPFIGINYHTKGFSGLKLLILGESHYCESLNIDCKLICGSDKNIDCSLLTKNVVNCFINYKKKVNFQKHKKWMNTFTKFTNVMYNKKVSNEQTIEFWNSIIFYNYVQSSMSGPRISPNKKQFKESEKAFFNVLNMYEPDLIIVWGNRLWNNLPLKFLNEDLEISDQKFENLKYYRVNNKNIRIYKVYHPASTKFNYEYSKYIIDIIEKIKNKVKI